MAAFHWEARRRQMQMGRRLRLQQEREGLSAGPGQEGLGEGQAKEPPPPPPSSRLQGTTEPSCTCNTAHALRHGGKLLNRHSTTEYIQQW